MLLTKAVLFAFGYSTLQLLLLLLLPTVI